MIRWLELSAERIFQLGGIYSFLSIAFDKERHILPKKIILKENGQQSATMAAIASATIIIKFW